MDRKIIALGIIILVGFTSVALGLHAFVSASGISVKALKGPETTDIYILYDNKTLTVADRVKIDAYYVNGTKKLSVLYKDVAISQGISIIPLTNLTQNDTVVVGVEIGSGKSKIDMTGQAIVKLRPDLAIQSISAPAVALNASSFNVEINATELNRDTGANFSITVKEGDSVLASAVSYVSAGGSAVISLPLLIDQVGTHSLSAIIGNSDPAEYSTVNNQLNFTVKVAKRPDLTVQNVAAPARVQSASSFSADVNVTELNKDTGANFTLFIKEGENILASSPGYVSAGGSAVISLPLLIDQVGTHSLSAVIGNSDPAEDLTGTGNNQQNFTVEIVQPVLYPDVAIQSVSAPNTTLSANYFNVTVSLTELGRETGANFNVTIKEADAVLASAPAYISAGGSTTVTIPVLINQAGIHILSVVVQDSNPAESNISNNQQNFTVEIIKPTLNPASYTTRYYSQTDEQYNSKNLNSAADGGTHIEVSEYTEKKISESLYYTLIVNKDLIFPLDHLYIRISNESGIIEEHENTNIVPTKVESGSSIASVYYPDTESTLTITSTAGATEIKFERKAKYQRMVSSGYNYYSESDNTSWSSNSSNQTGLLMNPLVSTSVYVELIDDGVGYGGTETMNLTAPVYSNSTWNDAGVTGYRNITTYYTKQNGNTSI